MIGLTYTEACALNPCSKIFQRFVMAVGGAEKWTGAITAAEARAAGATLVIRKEGRQIFIKRRIPCP